MLGPYVVEIRHEEVRRGKVEIFGHNTKRTCNPMDGIFQLVHTSVRSSIKYQSTIGVPDGPTFLGVKIHQINSHAVTN